MRIGSIMRLAVGVLASADWELAAANPAASEEKLLLHVHVYNLANISKKDLDRALENTSHILAAAGVLAVWELGDVLSPEGHIADISVAGTADRRMDDRGFLVVRFVRGLPASVLPGALGVSRPSAQIGGHVNVFYDRIEAVARTVQPGAVKILGSALAHEIGHVLLGSEQHSLNGIMKGVWTRADYQHLATRPLEFQSHEADVLREEVSRRAQLRAVAPPAVR
jgi:hypothetical protein